MGKLSGGDTDGVNLLMRRDFNTRISDPNEYFNVYDSEQGLMIRLIHALDRDVSMELRIAESYIFLFLSFQYWETSIRRLNS